jgi:putative nucleotidyltransferase with HDIG domain
MNIPSPDGCHRLMREMEMMDHIVAHSHRVCQVALHLAERLAERGLLLNHALVQSAALLHDITKTRSFQTGENHARTGETFLVSRGYPEVGAIVGQHVRLRRTGTPERLGEAEIVNYADKRVLHERIVSLDERMTYILDRYASTADHRRRLHRLWKETLRLEERIFQPLAVTPGNLAADIDGAPNHRQM